MLHCKALPSSKSCNYCIVCVNICKSIFLGVIRHVYGNDIAKESILLSKVRLFFSIIARLIDKKLSTKLAKILNLLAL